MDIRCYVDPSPASLDSPRTSGDSSSTTSRIRLIQVASPKRVAIFDLLWLEHTPSSLKRLLASSRLLKTGCLSSKQLASLGLQIVPFANLSRLAHWHPAIPTGKKCSLRTLVHYVLQRRLDRSQDASDWSLPDLGTAQVQSAADSVFAALLIYMRCVELSQSQNMSIPMPSNSVPGTPPSYSALPSPSLSVSSLSLPPASPSLSSRSYSARPLPPLSSEEMLMQHSRAPRLKTKRFVPNGALESKQPLPQVAGSVPVSIVRTDLGSPPLHPPSQAPTSSYQARIPRTFKCQNCSAKYSSRRGLAEHMHVAHEGRVFLSLPRSSRVSFSSTVDSSSNASSAHPTPSTSPSLSSPLSMHQRPSNKPKSLIVSCDASPTSSLSNATSPLHALPASSHSRFLSSSTIDSPAALSTRSSQSASSSPSPLSSPHDHEEEAPAPRFYTDNTAPSSPLSSHDHSPDDDEGEDDEGEDEGEDDDQDQVSSDNNYDEEDDDDDEEAEEGEDDNVLAEEMMVAHDDQPVHILSHSEIAAKNREQKLDAEAEIAHQQKQQHINSSMPASRSYNSLPTSSSRDLSLSHSSSSSSSSSASFENISASKKFKRKKKKSGDKCIIM